MIAKPVKEMNIEKLIEKVVKKVYGAALLMGMEKEKNEVKDTFKQTESRLYAYPELIDNICKYNKDIEDLKKESPGRSKDIVCFSTNGGGVRLSTEEIQEARILMVQKKILRDQAEIDEINFALQSIQADTYYKAVDMKYFKGKSDEEIADTIHCDPSTVRRNKNRLVRKLAVKLYGAQAVTGCTIIVQK